MAVGSIAEAVRAASPIGWAAVTSYALYLMRDSLPGIVGRFAGVEAFGVKFQLSVSQAMAEAIEIAQKHEAWKVEVPEADRRRALERARKESALLEGAEILWVDDQPSNNRNESRMLHKFGALVSFACTTVEAVGAIELAMHRGRPFHIVLSDMARNLPVVDPAAGLRMLEQFKQVEIACPVIFYIGSYDPARGIPPSAFGIANRPDLLLHLALDALARVR